MMDVGPRGKTLHQETPKSLRELGQFKIGNTIFTLYISKGLWIVKFLVKWLISYKILSNSSM